MLKDPLFPITNSEEPYKRLPVHQLRKMLIAVQVLLLLPLLLRVAVVALAAHILSHSRSLALS